MTYPGRGPLPIFLANYGAICEETRSVKEGLKRGFQVAVPLAVSSKDAKPLIPPFFVAEHI